MTIAKSYDVSFQLSGHDYSFKMELDHTQMTQGMILGALAQGRLYEPPLVQLLGAVLKPGDAFFDIGAHVGYFSIIASQMVGQGGRVITVEANSDNVARLRRHHEINGLKNQRIIEAAAADTVLTRQFYYNFDNDGGHALWDPGKHSFNKQSASNQQIVDVESVTIDSLVTECDVSRIKLIKIDTEGAEELILRGGLATLCANKELLIVCELNEFGLEQLGSSQGSLRSFMANHGYQTFLIDPNGALPKYVPPKVVIRSKTVENVLFCREDALADHWPVATPST